MSSNPSNPTKPNPQVQQVQAMFNGLSMGRKVTLIAGIVGLIISFLPWYSVSYSGFASASESAWHGWGFLAALLFIVAGVWVLLPLVGVQVRGILASLPPTVTEARLVMGIGVVALICTILFMVTQGPSVSVAGLSAGPSIGAYLGIVVSIAIIAGGYLMQSEPAA
jgi:hypothetical protein